MDKEICPYVIMNYYIKINYYLYIFINNNYLYSHRNNINALLVEQ